MEIKDRGIIKKKRCRERERESTKNGQVRTQRKKTVRDC